MQNLSSRSKSPNTSPQNPQTLACCRCRRRLAVFIVVAAPLLTDVARRRRLSDVVVDRVIQVALNACNMQLRPLEHPSEERVKTNPNLATAFLCHKGYHWFCLRKINDIWYTLDSIDSSPRPCLGPLTLLIESIQAAGGTLFVVRGEWKNVISEQDLFHNAENREPITIVNQVPPRPRSDEVDTPSSGYGNSQTDNSSQRNLPEVVQSAVNYVLYGDAPPQTERRFSADGQQFYHERIGSVQQANLRGQKMELCKQGSFKTEPCKWYKRGVVCHRGEHCPFAHGVQQANLRGPKVELCKQGSFKTELCKWYQRGVVCHRG